jgi:LacI family transcriptional regulator
MTVNARTGDGSGSAVTIRDVARHAGVSRMTVSRVLNGEATVKPATRQRVQDTINTLNFAPNPVARALAGRDQAKIALLHRFPNPGYLGEYMVCLLEEASKLFASLAVRKVSHTSEDRASVRELVARGTQGVVLAPPLADDEQLVELLRREGIAIVATAATWARDRVPWVGIDQAGLAADETLIARAAYTYRSGLVAAERLLSLPNPPTAIFASNDDMAAATVAIAHRRGIEVPRDLSVCGFDDTALATTIWPALTSVRLPTAEITRSALELLLRRLSGSRENAPNEQIVLPHTIVRRQSTAPIS